MLATNIQSPGISRSVAVAQRCRRVGCKAVSTKPVRQETMISSMTVPMVTALLASAPALAEEGAVGEAAGSVDVMAQNSGILGYTNGGLVIAFSPLIIYGAFYLYRAQINPKAKVVDLLFVTAACVVLGNILSILLFKVRLY